MLKTPGQVNRQSAERPLVLSIDIGSSSIRAGVYDRQGRVVADTMTKVRYQWTLGPGGSVRLPHETLLDLVGQAIDAVVENSGDLASEITAGGISCFFHSIVGVDAAGSPVTPVLSWSDTTSARHAGELRGTIDANELHAITGAPIHASYWPARILNLRISHPTVQRWVGLPELLAAHLTGEEVVSRSMASGTGLLDRATGEWSRGILDDLNVEVSDLARIVDDDEPIGPLTGTAAIRWRDLAGATWYAPWGDGACNNVGLATRDHGTAALTVGTSGSLRALIDDPAPGLAPGLFGFRLSKGSVVGGQLSEGGGALTWVAALFGRSTESLESEAGELGPDDHDLTVLPYMFGERGLGYHDNARGTINGLNASTSPGAVYRAFIDSIAYSFAAIDDELTLVLGHKPAITASGGAVARSPLLAQTIADALGRDIEVAPFLEASLRGAALLALQAGGDDALAHEVAPPPGTTIHHDAGTADAHRRARERRMTLYTSITGAVGPPGPRIEP